MASAASSLSTPIAAAVLAILYVRHRASPTTAAVAAAAPPPPTAAAAAPLLFTPISAPPPPHSPTPTPPSVHSPHGVTCADKAPSTPIVITAHVRAMGPLSVSLHDVPHLASLLPAHNRAIANGAFVHLVRSDEFVLRDVVQSGGGGDDPRTRDCVAYMRAGPRASLYFDASAVGAAIVTCGGLVPGENAVVRELVAALNATYGVTRILGIRRGWHGFHTLDALTALASSGEGEGGSSSSSSGEGVLTDSTTSSTTPSSPCPLQHAPAEEPFVLTPNSTARAHDTGGTLLGSDRGGFDARVIVAFCAWRRISQLYVVGGDGSMRGAAAVVAEALAQGLPLAVACIPKSLDNELPSVDRSFGFQTAVAETVTYVKRAGVEARGAIYGVGIVKVTGKVRGCACCC